MSVVINKELFDNEKYPSLYSFIYQKYKDRTEEEIKSINSDCYFVNFMENHNNICLGEVSKLDSNNINNIKLRDLVYFNEGDSHIITYFNEYNKDDQKTYPHRLILANKCYTNKNDLPIIKTEVKENQITENQSYCTFDFSQIRF